MAEERTAELDVIAIGRSSVDLFGQQIGSFVEKKYRELMAQDMRPGGMVWNAVKGQR